MNNKHNIAFLAVLALSFGALADTTYRFWNPTALGQSFGDGSLWNEAFADWSDVSDNEFVINCGTESNAVVTVGSTVSVNALDVGYGVNAAGQNSTDYDKGATLDVYGVLNVVNAFWIGRGWSDNYTSTANIHSDASVTAGSISIGSCSMYNDKRNVLTIDGGSLKTTGASNGGDATFGDNHYSSGNEEATVTISNGGKLDVAGHLYVGKHAAATLTMTGAASEIVNTNSTADIELFIGYGNSNANGTMIVEDGTVIVKQVGISNASGAKGRLEVRGGSLTATGTRWFGVANSLGGTGELTVSGGAVTNHNSSFCIGDRGTGTVRVSDGILSSHYMTVGQNGDSTGYLYINGGEVTTEGNSLHIGNRGAGTLEMSGGTLSINYFGIGESSSGTGTAKISGGTVNINANLNVGNGGNGRLELSNATLSPNGFTIGASQDKYGEVVVNNGGVITNRSNDINLASHGRATFTINEGGRVYTAWWFRLGPSNTSIEDSGAVVLNLNGGELNVGKVSAQNSYSSKTINWNGGTFKPTDNYTDIEPSDYITVNVLAGGAIIDTGSKDRNYAHSLTGVGFLRKKGSSKLTLNGSSQVDLKRGFIVEQGSLVINSGKIANNTALTPIKEISVADGATLDLGGAELYVQHYTLAGVAKAAGDYTAHNGTIHVSVAGAPVAATWTNATGDGDVTKPENWEVFNAEGAKLWDALPTAATKVTIPYGTEIEELAAFSSAETILSVSGSRTLHSKVSVPAIAKSAIAWYDPADADAIVYNASGAFSGVANKGTAGEALDLEQQNATDHPAAYDADNDEWKLNGLPVFAFTNSWGLVSKGGVGFSGNNDRTVIILRQHQWNKYVNEIDSETGEVQSYWNEMHSFDISGGSWTQKRFLFEDRNNYGVTFTDGYKENSSLKGTEYWLNDNGIPYISADTWELWDIGSSNRTIFADRWTENDDVLSGQNAPTSAGLLTEQDWKMTIGTRYSWPNKSAGLIAEVFLFDKTLDADEMETMRRYMRIKWFDYVDTAFLPQSLSLGMDAELNLNGTDVTFENIYDSGTISNGDVTVTGTITITVNSDGTIDPLVIDGALTLGENAKLVIQGAQYLTRNPVNAITATGGVTGAFATVEIDSDKPAKVKIVDGVVTVAKGGGFTLVVS